MNEPVIYFVQAGGEEGPIKIGRSRSVFSRLAAMSTHSSEPLSLLGTLPDPDGDLEGRLHRHFSDARIKGEWFDWSQIATEVRRMLEEGVTSSEMALLEKHYKRSEKSAHKPLESGRSPSLDLLDPSVSLPWVLLIRAHTRISREVSSRLQQDHGLTLSDYEVLLELAKTPGQRMKRIELANHLRLTPSGITRLLDGLEDEGYVMKEPCSTDGRVSYACLADKGLTKLKHASCSYTQELNQLFASKFTEEELGELSQLLLRLS